MSFLKNLFRKKEEKSTGKVIIIDKSGSMPEPTPVKKTKTAPTPPARNPILEVAVVQRLGKRQLQKLLQQGGHPLLGHVIYRRGEEPIGRWKIVSGKGGDLVDRFLPLSVVAEQKGLLFIAQRVISS